MRLGKNTVQVSLRIPEEVHKRLQELAQETDRQGFTDGEIEAVFSQNVLRLYRELL